MAFGVPACGAALAGRIDDQIEGQRRWPVPLGSKEVGDLVDLDGVQPGRAMQEPVDEVVAVNVGHAVTGGRLLRKVSPNNDDGLDPAAG